jgi:hypothetical protein
MRADSTPNNSDRLHSPQGAIAYLKERYGIVISLASFYSMISRGAAPKVTYFRGRPRFTQLILTVARKLLSQLVLQLRGNVPEDWKRTCHS